jgi:hypothetical protein
MFSKSIINNSVTVICRIYSYHLLFIPSFLPTYSDTHYKCRGQMSHLITLNDTYFLGRTPLDEGSVLRRYLYLTTHNIHMTQISRTPAGFETAIPASARPQTLTVGRATTGIGHPLFPRHYHQPQMETGSHSIVFSRGKLKSTVRLQSRKHSMRCYKRKGWEVHSSVEVPERTKWKSAFWKWRYKWRSIFHW